jgi:hypothetical protein
MKKMMVITTILVLALTACQSSSDPEQSAAAQGNPEGLIAEPVETEAVISEAVEPEEVVAEQMKPEDIVLAQVEPMNHGDIKAALELYADDVELQLAPTFAMLPGSPDHYRGKDELKAYFESLVESHIQLQIDVQQVEGNTVTTKTYTWMDLTRDLDIAPLEATEVYTIQDGKIKSWTWTLSDQSLKKLQDSPPVLSITFQKDGCIYNGPKSVETPSAIIVWNDASGEKRAGYGVTVEMFSEGKTPDDRLEAPSAPPPEWTTIIGIALMGPSHQFATQLFNDGPIYLVCLVDEGDGKLHKVLDVMGPITIDFWK